MRNKAQEQYELEQERESQERFKQEVWELIVSKGVTE